MKLSRHVLTGLHAWITLRSGSRPRRILDRLLRRLKPLPARPAITNAAVGDLARPDQLLIYYWINATAAFPANTGIQRVARQLARALIEAGFELVPVKWGGPSQPLHPVSSDDLAHFALWNGPSPDSWSAWIPPQARQGAGWLMMAELPLDLTDRELKLVRTTAEAASLKTAAVFYDVIPWTLRDLYTKAYLERWSNYLLEICQYTAVMAISRYSHDALVRLLGEEHGVPAGSLRHVRTCELAGDFPHPSTSSPSAPDRAEGGVRILCVGSLETRKNHRRLLDAFDRARLGSVTPLHLTIAGRSLEVEPEVAALVRRRAAKDSGVDWEDKADDARVGRLYAECDFTVYPSLEEGFGLPILESLWLGKPCICANFGAMAEVAAGGGCLTVDVTDTDALVGAIRDLANSPERLKALAAEARARSFRTWRDYARDVAGVLDLPF